MGGSQLTFALRGGQGEESVSVGIPGNFLTLEVVSSYWPE